MLFSVHLKATMMKVSDPIIFGHVVRAFFPALYAEHGDALAAAGIVPNDGLGDAVRTASTSCATGGRPSRPRSRSGWPKGRRWPWSTPIAASPTCTCPSDMIVDASMPAMIRTSGHMWGPDGEEADTLAVIPDSSYAGIYQAVIDDCRANGAFDPATMGSVPNVGLMAQAAEEYGSHDKTFEIPARRHRPRRRRRSGTVLMEHAVAAGDIWRMCQTKDVPIRDWVKLAVTRARATGAPAVFWLDESRAHDANLIAKVQAYLADHDTNGLQIEIKAPVDAMEFSLERIRRGEDTIGCTGNVLRDYLTDLFPILELGTSAKMLSVVPLINGGGLFETGAGGSAPKHVQQLVKENHLRWDSLGEFFALAASFEHLANATANKRAQILADTLDLATGTFLNENKSPSRKVGRDRQPRQPLLPGALLGAGAGRPVRRPRAGRRVRAAGGAARRRRGGDRRRAAGRAGPARRPRRLLLPGSGEGHRGHAPVADLQRRARHAVGLSLGGLLEALEGSLHAADQLVAARRERVELRDRRVHLERLGHRRAPVGGGEAVAPHGPAGVEGEQPAGLALRDGGRGRPLERAELVGAAELHPDSRRRRPVDPRGAHRLGAPLTHPRDVAHKREDGFG